MKYAVARLALPLVIFSCAVKAQNSESDAAGNSPFSADISIGAEYDSNVSVDQVDTTTGADDVATTVDLELDFETDISSNTELSVSYSFSQSTRDEFSEFDVRSHFIAGEVTHEMGKTDIGFAYRYVSSKLDGADFLKLRQVSPFISKLFARKIFLRADYTYSEKSFNGRAERDADTHAGNIDLYWFLNGARRYWVFGYKYEDENTVSAEFDFKAHKLKVRYVQRLRFGHFDTKLRLGWRYESRDYSSITPSIRLPRDDERHRLEAEIEVPLSARLYTVLHYEYADFESNLASANYKQDIVSLKIGAQF